MIKAKYIALVAMLSVALISGCGDNNKRQAVNNNDTQKTEQAQPVEPQAQKVDKGVPFGDKTFELTIQNATLTPEVHPEGGREVMYKKAPDGSIFLDTVVSIKNLQKKDEHDAGHKIRANIIYGDGYEYPTTFEISVSVDFTDANNWSFSPLIPENCHFIGKLPAEVTTNNKPIKVVFDLEGDKYEYQYR